MRPRFLNRGGRAETLHQTFRRAASTPFSNILSATSACFLQAVSLHSRATSICALTRAHWNRAWVQALDAYIPPRFRCLLGHRAISVSRCCHMEHIRLPFDRTSDFWVLLSRQAVRLVCTGTFVRLECRLFLCSLGCFCRTNSLHSLRVDDVSPCHHV